jgi:hypothetical protein
MKNTFWDMPNTICFIYKLYIGHDRLHVKFHMCTIYSSLITTIKQKLNLDLAQQV